MSRPSSPFSPCRSNPFFLLIVAFIAGLVTRELSLPVTSRAAFHAGSHTLPHYTEWEDPKAPSSNVTASSNSSADTVTRAAPADGASTGSKTDGDTPGADTRGTPTNGGPEGEGGDKWGRRRDAAGEEEEEGVHSKGKGWEDESSDDVSRESADSHRHKSSHSDAHGHSSRYSDSHGRNSPQSEGYVRRGSDRDSDSDSRDGDSDSSDRDSDSSDSTDEKWSSGQRKRRKSGWEAGEGEGKGIEEAEGSEKRRGKGEWDTEGEREGGEWEEGGRPDGRRKGTEAGDSFSGASSDYGEGDEPGSSGGDSEDGSGGEGVTSTGVGTDGGADAGIDTEGVEDRGGGGREGEGSFNQGSSRRGRFGLSGAGGLRSALGSVLGARDGRTRAGRKWATPFVRSEFISIEDEPACDGIVPRSYLRKGNRQPITSLSDLKRPGQRILLFAPRFGLGNSLRGYVSAFVYALLSGRRIVRLHAGQHAKVYDLLCQGFDCGFDSIHWNPDNPKAGPQMLWREFAKLRPFNMLPHKLKTRGVIKSLKFSYPLVVAKVASFFDFWQNKPQLKQCVYRALNCRSIWCVHSRAIYALLGRGPTRELEQTIGENVERREYTGGNDIPAEVLNLAPRQVGVDMMFDVSVHVRTRTEAVEHSHTNECEGDAGCKQRFMDAAQARTAKYLSPRLWGCIRKIVQKRKVDLFGLRPPSRPFTIFLATDNQQMRNAFVDRLATMGTVYYSSGKVVHTSKVSGGLPTLAEWYLLAKANLVLEAESYVSTFAYFSGLLGNSTLASLSIKSMKRCSLKVAHDSLQP